MRDNLSRVGWETWNTHCSAYQDKPPLSKPTVLKNSSAGNSRSPTPSRFESMPQAAPASPSKFRWHSICWETWIRTMIHGFKGRCPTIRRSPNRVRIARKRPFCMEPQGKGKAPHSIAGPCFMLRMPGPCRSHRAGFPTRRSIPVHDRR